MQPLRQTLHQRAVLFIFTYTYSTNKESAVIRFRAAHLLTLICAVIATCDATAGIIFDESVNGDLSGSGLMLSAIARTPGRV